MAYPANYRFTKEHEWIDETGKVGITDYAQSSLGDIVFVDLPRIGSSIEKGKTFGSVESVKAVSDLYAPVSGTVKAINEELATAPEKINADAHSAWILQVDLSDVGQLEGLLDGAAYEAYVKEETH